MNTAIDFLLDIPSASKRGGGVRPGLKITALPRVRNVPTEIPSTPLYWSSFLLTPLHSVPSPSSHDISQAVSDPRWVWPVMLRQAQHTTLHLHPLQSQWGLVMFKLLFRLAGEEWDIVTPVWERSRITGDRSQTEERVFVVLTFLTKYQSEENWAPKYQGQGSHSSNLNTLNAILLHQKLKGWGTPSSVLSLSTFYINYLATRLLVPTIYYSLTLSMISMSEYKELSSKLKVEPSKSLRRLLLPPSLSLSLSLISLKMTSNSPVQSLTFKA